MNWKDSEGQSLLWEAFPRGYLKRADVKTLGGWEFRSNRGMPHCTRLEYGMSTMLKPPQKGWVGARDAGHLLPDPTDPETLDLLKRELPARVKKAKADVEIIMAAVEKHSDPGWAVVKLLGRLGGVE